MYSRLHEHFSRLADEIETAMKAKLSGVRPVPLPIEKPGEHAGRSEGIFTR
jgi:hypothetical protein